MFMEVRVYGTAASEKCKTDWNVCDEPKIYVEDYVDTFLGQLQEKAMEKPVAAALTGEVTKCEDKVVVYISGAIRAEDVEVEGTNLKISEEIWEKIEKEQKEYFKDQKLIGWCLWRQDIQ